MNWDDEEDFLDFVMRGNLAVVRENVFSNEYGRWSILDNLNMLRKNPDEHHKDYFLRILFALIDESPENENYNAKFLLDSFDIFVEEGSIFKNPKKMMSVFTSMFQKNNLIFYPIVASYINGRTWRGIHEEAMSLLHRPDYEEIVVIGLFSCLKLAGGYFSEAEKTEMTTIIEETFDMSVFGRDPSVFDGTERFIVYVRNHDYGDDNDDDDDDDDDENENDDDDNENDDGDEDDDWSVDPTSNDEEQIGIADGIPMLITATSAWVGQVNTVDWQHVNEILEMDPIAYSKHQIKHFVDERRADGSENAKFLKIELPRRFKQVKFRSCARELVDFMLTTASFELHDYLYLELARLTVDCVGTGVISQFKAMQIITNVMIRFRNARARQAIETKKSNRNKKSK